jgi:SAM-dependent methyltransferase
MSSTPSGTLPPLTWWGAMRWAAVLPLLPEERSTVVAEFGCGQGSFGARLAQRFDTYVGIEPSARSAEIAADRVAGSGGVVVADWQDSRNPVADGGADLLVAFEVLEHLEDDAGTLASWLRAARPGAKLVVSVPAEPERFGPWDENVGHYRRYSVDGLVETLTRAGLVQARAQHYGYPFGYALETARNTIARRRPVDPQDVAMEDRTEGSGRLRQPRSPLVGDLRWMATAPFRAWQSHYPSRGPGLVGWARVSGRH